MTVLPIRPLPMVMTTQVVAKVLRCSEETVGRYILGHQLVAIHIGRERRIRAQDLLDFIDARPTSAKQANRRGKRVERR